MALTVYAIKVETFELPVKKNSSNGEKNAIFPFFDRDKKSMFFKRAETSAKKYKLLNAIKRIANILGLPPSIMLLMNIEVGALSPIDNSNASCNIGLVTWD